MKYYDEESYYASQEPEKFVMQEEPYCGYCWDKRKQKRKELFFLDHANNMRVCLYCPSCGRKYEEE